ncbi:MAG: serine/threonine-protein kinase, partial [Cyanobacteria bacterium J06650_10]
MDPLIGGYIGNALLGPSSQHQFDGLVRPDGSVEPNGLVEHSNRPSKRRYQVKSLLGKQTGRRTYLAYDAKDDRSVVIKLVLFGPDFTWADLRLFEREAETLKSLDHSALPNYLDSFEVETPMGKGFALVQTYIDASSLQQQVNAGRTFSEPDLIDIARQILAILRDLHARHPPIIHRDIKPSNILLTNHANGSIKKVYLIDFGSVQTTPSSGTMTIVGTYGYMPIEQFGGRAFPASDLYSLGATLLYLSTGKHPAELVQSNFQLDFTAHVQFTPVFTQWIEQLVRADLSQRTASATAALRVLAQLSNTDKNSERVTEPSRNSTVQKSEINNENDSSNNAFSSSSKLSEPKDCPQHNQPAPNRTLRNQKLRDRSSKSENSLQLWQEQQSVLNRRKPSHHFPLRLNDLELSISPEVLSIQLLAFRLKEETAANVFSPTLAFVAGWSLVLWTVFLLNGSLGILLLFLMLICAGILNQESHREGAQNYRKASICIWLSSPNGGMQLSSSALSWSPAQPPNSNRALTDLDPVKLPLLAIKSGPL